MNKPPYKKLTKSIIYLSIFFALWLSLHRFAQASESNGTILNEFKYAWGENLGWINFRPSTSGLNITDANISGYAWSQSFGWINFAPGRAGVTNNCNGHLGGYAWSDQKGWIDFSGVTINALGKFVGMAGTLGTTAGRINFSCVNCDVRTDWRPCNIRDSQSGGGGGGSGGEPPTVPPTPPTPPTPPEPSVPPVPPVPNEPPVTPPTPDAEPPAQPPTEVPPPNPPPSNPAQPAAPGSSAEGANPSTPSLGSSGGGSTTPASSTNEYVYQPTSSTPGFRTSTSPAQQIIPNQIQSASSSKIKPQNILAGAQKKLAENPIIKSVNKIISNAGEKVTEIASEPAVQATALPTLSVIAVANVASSAGWLQILNYLYYLFTQPLLLLGRDKKRKYGTVYNSLSKLPLDLAIIRIKDGLNRIVQTKITDRNGRYNFLVPKGEYSVEISKTGYFFPSSLFVGKTDDIGYPDLLTTEKLNLENDSVLSKSVPLDPVEEQPSPAQIKRKILFRRINGAAALSTTVLSIGALIMAPSYPYLGLAVFQVIIYFIFLRLAYKRSPPSFGVIKDKEGKAIRDAVVRIVDAQFDRVLETQITDSKGQYTFLVGKGKFYITVSKDGHQIMRSELIDCSKAEGSTVIDKEFRLEKTLGSDSQGQN